MGSGRNPSADQSRERRSNRRSREFRKCSAFVVQHASTELIESQTAVSINGMSTLEYPHGRDLLHPKDVGRLLLRCDDRPGLVAAVSAFLAGAGANIVSLDQHATQQTGGIVHAAHDFHLPGLAAARDAL